MNNALPEPQHILIICLVIRLSLLSLRVQRIETRRVRSIFLVIGIIAIFQYILNYVYDLVPLICNHSNECRF